MKKDTTKKSNSSKSRRTKEMLEEYDFSSGVRGKYSKKFDSVKMMREIRDKLSEEFQKMSFEEQRKFLDSQIKPKVRRVAKRNAKK